MSKIVLLPAAIVFNLIQHSIVNAPVPNPNSVEVGTVRYPSIATAPTLTVIVVSVSAVIVRARPDEGSVALGYALFAVLPSWAQVNTTPPSVIVTLFDVVRVWVPISITISPVNGSYVVPVAAVNDPVAPLLAIIASVTPLTKVCADAPGDSARHAVPYFLLLVLSWELPTNVAVW